MLVAKNWEANKPTRMLIMELTDGINSIMGMEFQPIPLLKPSTPPGTKVSPLSTDGVNSVMGMECQPISLLRPSTPPGTTKGESTVTR